MQFSVIASDLPQEWEKTFCVPELEMATQTVFASQVYMDQRDRSSVYSDIDETLMFYELDRFEASWLLKKLRNKRLMYVGDSLNRNQWESMVCMAQSGDPSGNKTTTAIGSLTIFRIEVGWVLSLID